MPEPLTPLESTHEQLLNRLLVEQRRRWLHGDPASVEHLIQEHPELAADRELLLNLITAEALLREEASDKPNLEENRLMLVDIPCPPRELLRRSIDLDDPMSASQREYIGAHVDACQLGCKPAVAELLHCTLPALDRAETPSQAATLAPTAPVPALTSPPIPGYEILTELGRGGMGIVYQARQRKLNRLVALKVILAGPYALPRQLARFQAEARVIARLQHPHIVQIFDIGENEGTPYLALEYVDGGNLAQRQRSQPHSVRESAELVRTLAQAVHAAHQKGVIHRDLKPGNVLLTKAGAPKIADFGLAKEFQSEDDTATNAPAAQTATGEVMGTPNYMAPEQAAGTSQAIGPATDVYALGAILYELLTGSPPFRGATPIDTVYQVLHTEPVPPRKLKPTLPRDLDIICLKCLQKDPTRRYAAAEGLAQDLTRFLEHEPIQARPVGRTERFLRWCRREPRQAVLAAALLFVLLGVAIGSLFVWRQSQRQRAEIAAAFIEAGARADRLLAVVEQEQLSFVPQAEASRRVVLEDIVASYRAALGQQINDPDLRQAAARAQRRLGNALELLDDHAGAERAYQAAHSLHREAPNADVAEAAAACWHLGNLRARKASFHEAEQLYQEGLNLAAQEGIESHAALRGKCAQGLGTVQASTGQLAQAEATFRKALNEQPDLTDSPRERLAEAQMQSSLASLLLSTARIKEAERLHALAVATQRELVAQHPAIPVYRLGLVRRLEAQARFQEETFRYVEAYTTHENVLEICQRLVADHPHVADYQQELAGVMHALARLINGTAGKVKNSRIRNESVVPLYREAIATNEKLAAKYPDVPEYRRRLANSLNTLAVLLNDRKQVEEAEKLHRQGQPLWHQLVAEHPEVPDYQDGLVLSILNFNNLLTESKRFEEAERVLTHATQLTTGLVQRHPNVLRYQSRLAFLNNSLGVLADRRGQNGKAEEFFRLAVRGQEQVLSLNPDNPDAARLLVVNRLNLSEMLVRRGEHHEAAGLMRNIGEVFPIHDHSLYAHYVGMLGQCLRLAADDASLTPFQRVQTADKYGDWAMMLTRDAGKGCGSGYLKSDKAFDALRQRSDFQELVRDLEAKEAAAKP